MWIPETNIDIEAVARETTQTDKITKWEKRSLYHFGGIGRILKIRSDLAWKDRTNHIFWSN